MKGNWCRPTDALPPLFKKSRRPHQEQKPTRPHTHLFRALNTIINMQWDKTKASGGGGGGAAGGLWPIRHCTYHYYRRRYRRRSGGERERERWVATHQKESSWRRRQIYLSNRRQSPCTTSLALPIVVLPSLYNTSVGGRDIKQPPWPWRPPSIPRRVVIQVIRRRGYNIRHFCMCVCMLDWCRGWFLNWNFGWGRSCYLSLVVDEGDAQIGHGSQDGHQRLNGVAVDHRSILFEIVRCEAALVNDSKLKMRKIGNFSFSFSGREFSNDFFLINAQLSLLRKAPLFQISFSCATENWQVNFHFAARRQVTHNRETKNMMTTMATTFQRVTVYDDDTFFPKILRGYVNFH